MESSPSIKSSPCAKSCVCRGSISNFNILTRTWATDNNCISCTVHNYPDLVNSVLHCLKGTVSDLKYQLKVLKKSNTHFFHLHCHTIHGMTLYIKYGEDEFSMAIPSKRTGYGYYAEAPRQVVCDPRNMYLHKEGTLVVQFHQANPCFFTRMPFAANGKRTGRDEELFSRDMLKLYEIRNSTGDFFIHVRSKRFIVHKFVFKARTMLIPTKPNSSSSKRVRIKGDPSVMDKVVRYIYSGVLEEIDLDNTLKVLEIAVNLNMLSLVQTVSASLIRRLTKDNAMKVLEVARKFDIIDLMLCARDYIM